MVVVRAVVGLAPRKKYFRPAEALRVDIRHSDSTLILYLFKWIEMSESTVDIWGIFPEGWYVVLAKMLCCGGC